MTYRFDLHCAHMPDASMCHTPLMRHALRCALDLCCKQACPALYPPATHFDASTHRPCVVPWMACAPGSFDLHACLTCRLALHFVCVPHTSISFMCVCTGTQVWTHVETHTHIHIQSRPNLHACMCACMCVCVCVTGAVLDPVPLVPACGDVPSISAPMLFPTRTPGLSLPPIPTPSISHTHSHSISHAHTHAHT